MKMVSNIETQRQAYEANKDSSLTLNRFIMLIYDQFQKLKTIYILVDSCRSIFLLLDCIGCCLLSAIYSYSKCLIPSQQKVAYSFLEHMSAPLMDMIQQWAVYGELSENNEGIVLIKNSLYEMIHE